MVTLWLNNLLMKNSRDSNPQQKTSGWNCPSLKQQRTQIPLLKVPFQTKSIQLVILLQPHFKQARQRWATLHNLINLTEEWGVRKQLSLNISSKEKNQKFKRLQVNKQESLAFWKCTKTTDKMSIKSRPRQKYSYPKNKIPQRKSRLNSSSLIQSLSKRFSSSGFLSNESS